MRVPRDSEATRVELVAADPAAMPVRASRELRRVEPWPEPLLFLPALLPLLVGFAVRIGSRRRAH